MRKKRNPALNVKRKNRRKIIKVIGQIILLAVAAVVLVNAVFDLQTYQEPDKSKWRQDKGFIALSYFGVGRSGTSKLVSQDQLDAQLKALHDQGYETILQQDVIDYYEKGAPLPDKALFLSFEDGLNDSALFAQPILEKYKPEQVPFGDLWSQSSRQKPEQVPFGDLWSRSSRQKPEQVPFRDLWSRSGRKKSEQVPFRDFWSQSSRKKSEQVPFRDLWSRGSRKKPEQVPFGDLWSQSSRKKPEQVPFGGLWSQSSRKKSEQVPFGGLWSQSSRKKSEQVPFGDLWSQSGRKKPEQVPLGDLWSQSSRKKPEQVPFGDLLSNRLAVNMQKHVAIDKK